MKQFGETIVAFLMGFFLYTLIEIAGRGYTHWTMAIAGGLTLALLYHMECTLCASHIEKALLGAVFVTALEFTIGVFVNLIMGWEVWNYSEIHPNLLGQICLPFSALWFVLCIPASLICHGIHQKYRPGI